LHDKILYSTIYLRMMAVWPKVLKRIMYIVICKTKIKMPGSYYSSTAD